MASISDHLRAIAKADEVPKEALTALVAQIDEAAPPLRDILDKVARGRPLSDEDASLFFYGLHVLAAGRDRQSFPALLKFLRRPAEEVEDLLGDAATQSLQRVVAGLFDDDAEALLGAAADMRIDAYAREALIGAAAFLTWDGRIPRERLHDFLKSLEEEASLPAGDFAWLGWTLAVTHLGFRDLEPHAKRVFAATLQPENVMDWSHIEQDLRDAERAPSDIERFTSIGLGYADDILDTLAWTEYSGPGELPEQPIVNPNRNVGRNDPCPCGSGKKYKKCCLVNG